MANIGFIGLGIMGAPMAGHLLDGGHQRASASAARAPPQALVDAGREAAARTARRSREGADIVITMVPDTPHVEEVLFGDGRRRGGPVARARWSST